MLDTELIRLGDKIARLRLARNLKQAELAYEAGISQRTLQRIEAGEVVKSDGLLRVIAYLDRLEEMLLSLDTPSLSPYELATRSPASAVPTRRRRVKRKKAAPEPTLTNRVWPEDQP